MICGLVKVSANRCCGTTPVRNATHDGKQGLSIIITQPSRSFCRPVLGAIDTATRPCDTYHCPAVQDDSDAVMTVKELNALLGTVMKWNLEIDENFSWQEIERGRSMTLLPPEFELVRVIREASNLIADHSFVA